MTASHPAPDRPASAAGAILLAMTAVSLHDALVKLLVERISVWQTQMLRSLLAAAMLVIAAHALGRLAQMRPERMFWPMVRAGFSGVAYLLFYASLPSLTLTEAGAGFFALPLFATLFSLLSRQPVSRPRMAGLALGLIGLLMVLRPDLAPFRWAGLGPVAAAALFALGVTWTRDRIDQGPSMGLAAAQNLVYALIGGLGVAALTFWQAGPVARASWPALASGWSPAGAMVGLLLFAAAGLLLLSAFGEARAFRLSVSGRAAPLQFVYLPLALVWDLAIFGQSPSLLAILGAALVAMAGALISWPDTGAPPPPPPQGEFGGRPVRFDTPTPPERRAATRPSRMVAAPARAGEARASEDRPLMAVGLIIAAMALLGLTDNFVRIFAADMGLGQFHLIRALLAAPLVLLGLRLVSEQAVLPASPGWVLLRSLIMTASMLLFFGSIPLMPITQAAAGLFTSPLFVLVFSALFLGERVGPKRVLAVAAGFGGALLILDPFNAAIDWRAMLPVCAGALYALSIIITRRRCRDESPLALVLANYLMFAVMGGLGLALVTLAPPPEELRAQAPFLFGGWGPLSAALLLGMLGMAAGSAISVAALTKAYQSAESSFLALFDYSYVIPASLFGFLIWDERPPAQSWLGVAMIVAAGVYLALRRDGAAALRSPGPGPELAAQG